MYTILEKKTIVLFSGGEYPVKIIRCANCKHVNQVNLSKSMHECYRCKLLDDVYARIDFGLRDYNPNARLQYYDRDSVRHRMNREILSNIERREVPSREELSYINTVREEFGFGRIEG